MASGIIVLILAVLGVILCAVAAIGAGNERLGFAGAALVGVAVVVLAAGGLGG
jgi:hypothetical protein